ncbi:MAG: hypothetical protein RJB13_1679 [Pseudomonadota bacterium]|jgi:hypothetical protein
MKSWQSIGLAVVAAAAIWGGVFLDEHFAEKEATQQKQDERLLVFESKDVLELTLKNENGQFKFIRENSGANWQLAEPTGAKPDQDAVNNMIAAVQSAKFEQQIDSGKGIADALKSGDSAAGKDYGFESPRVALTLKLAANKELGTSEREAKLWLGGDVGIGSGAGSAFNAISLYAVSSDKTGLLVSGHSLASTLGKGLKDLRTKLIGDFIVSEVSTITLSKNDGSVIQIEKKKDDGQNQWHVVSPKAIKADNNQVGLFLDSLVRLRADTVTEPSAISDANKGALGLTEPNATLVLKDASGKELQKIDYGLTKEALSLTMSDGAVGSVELTKFTELAPELKFFRDRRVLTDVNFNDVNVLTTLSGKKFQKEGINWYAADATTQNDDEKMKKAANEDVRRFVEDWEFMTAEDVLDADEATELSKFGLDKPITQFSLSSTAENKPKIEVLAGSRVPSNEKAVYVKRTDKPEVFVMESKWLDVLTRLDQGEQSPQAKK